MPDPNNPPVFLPTNECADMPYAITADANGNIGLTGQYSGSVNFGNGAMPHDAGYIPTQESYDAFLGRFTPAGQVLWTRRIASQWYDAGRTVAAAPDGDLVVGGGVSNEVDFGDGQVTTPNGNGDAFIARYAAADGALVFKKRFGANGADATRGVVVDANDNTIAAGWFQGSFDALETPGNFNDDITATGGTADQDSFVVKYGPTGSLLWAKKFGTGASDYAYGIATDRVGNIYISGMFYGTITFGATPSLTSAGTYDAYVVKLDGTTGAPMWAKRIGGAQDDAATALTVDDPNDGIDNATVLVAGTFRDSVTFPTGSPTTRTTSGVEDVFVARLGSAGAMSSIVTAGGSAKDFPASVAVDATGRAIVTGYFGATANFGGAPFTATGALDMFLASYTLPTSSATGTHNWSRQYSGLANQYATGVAVAPSGRILLSGAAERTVNFGFGPRTSLGLYDIAFASLPSPPP